MNNIDKDRMEVCVCFGASEWEKGRKILFKLYNTKLRYLTNIEDIRFIIYNLAWVEYRLKNIDSAKLYINEIKNIFENNIEYMENYPTHYCAILEQYLCTYQECIDDETQICIYEKTYDIYKKINSKSMYMSLHNIYNTRKEYYKIPNVIEEMLKSIGDYHHFLKDMMDNLYSKDLKSYEKALKIVYNFKMSNTSVS